MMDKLVFLIHDATPDVCHEHHARFNRSCTRLIHTQHWADFCRAADIPHEARGPDKEPARLYIPVHSPSQQDLTPQDQISATLKTEFQSASWEQIRRSFKNFVERDSISIHPVVFLILDKQSIEDRKVIVVHEGAGQWFTPEGDYADNTMQDRNDLIKKNVWKKYRVPFEKAWTAQCAIEGFCSLEHAEPYFEKDLMGDVCVEEHEEQSEETDSDETTSTDLEYQ
jgi:hypothetical protein